MDLNSSNSIASPGLKVKEKDNCQRPASMIFNHESLFQMSPLVVPDFDGSHSKASRGSMRRSHSNQKLPNLHSSEMQLEYDKSSKRTRERSLPKTKEQDEQLPNALSSYTSLASPA